MIGGKDVYLVVESLVPLYVSLILAYGSVRWWKIFTPEQCVGLNRFVSVFAVPFLAFYYTMQIDPYTVNLKFLAADSLQKVVTLLLLTLWNTFTKWGSFNWTITLFSLTSFPNTLVMGIPLLKSMYGDFTTGLMIEIVFFQVVIWNTLLLFLFEYRAAKLLLSQQLPNTVRVVESFKVESNFSSISVREPLHADAKIGENGELQVRDVMSRSMSVASSLIHKSDSLERERASSFGVTNVQQRCKENRFWRSKSCSDRISNNGLASSYPILSGSSPTSNMRLHWSSSELPISNVNMRYDAANGSFNLVEFPQEIVASKGAHELEEGEHPIIGSQKKGSIEEADASRKRQMSTAAVMTRLTLIMVWRSLIRNTSPYAVVGGLIWSLVSFRWKFKMPYIIERSVSIVSDTALGMSMFSLGIFIALQPKFIACGIPRAVMGLAIRFLVGPLLIVATSKASGIRGDLFDVAVIQAALPLAIVPFLYAQKYNLHPDILSSVVVFGMVVALPVTIAYYFILNGVIL